MSNYKRVIGLDDFATYLCGRISLGQFNRIEMLTIKNNFIECLRSIKQVDNYYFIFHDETDTLHLHYLVYLNKAMRCLTFINKISNFMSINSDMILCDKCIDVGKYLRYIVHQDEQSVNDNKKSYDVENIYSDNPIEVINSFMNMKKGNISYDYLVSLVLRYKWDSDIMRALTPSIYHKYRYEIDILKQERAYLQQLKDESEELPF